MNFHTNPEVSGEQRKNINSRVEELLDEYNFESNKKRFLQENCERTDILACIEYDGKDCLHTCNYAKERER